MFRFFVAFLLLPTFAFSQVEIDFDLDEKDIATAAELVKITQEAIDSRKACDEKFIATVLALKNKYTEAKNADGISTAERILEQVNNNEPSIDTENLLIAEFVLLVKRRVEIMEQIDKKEVEDKKKVQDKANKPSFEYSGQILTLDEYIKHADNDKISKDGWKVKAIITGVDFTEEGKMELEFGKKIKYVFEVPRGYKLVYCHVNKQS